MKDTTTTPYQAIQLHVDNDTVWSWIHRTGNNNPSNHTIGLRVRSHGTNETGTLASLAAYSKGNDTTYASVDTYTSGKVVLGGVRRPAGSAFSQFQESWYDSTKFFIAGTEALRLDFDVRNQLTMLNGGYISRSDITTFVPVVRGEFARTGTTAVQADDFLFAIIGKGYDGTDYETGGTVEFRTTENWSGSARGSQIEFYTVPNTTTTLTLAAELGNDQSWTVKSDRMNLDLISSSLVPAFTGRRARAGTTAVQSGDFLIALLGQGYDGDSYETGGEIGIVPTETWDNTGRGTEVRFYSTSNNSTSLTLGLTLQQDQKLLGVNDWETPAEITSTVGEMVSSSVSNTVIPVFRGKFARAGTTAVQSGDFLAALLAQGYDGDSYESGGEFSANATETWDNSGRGTELRFYTVSNNSTTLTERMTIEQNGAVTIPGAITASSTGHVFGGATISNDMDVTGDYYNSGTIGYITSVWGSATDSGWWVAGGSGGSPTIQTKYRTLTINGVTVEVITRN